MNESRIPSEFRFFMEKELPEVESKIGELSLLECLEVFNAMLDLDIKSTERISDSAQRMLTVMRDMNTRGTLQRFATPRAIRKIGEIKSRRGK